MDILVEENKKLISWVYKKYFSDLGRTTHTHEDFMQEGYVGLLKAVRDFDESKEVKFSTYAVLKIRGEMQAFKKRFYGVTGTRRATASRHSISLDFVTKNENSDRDFYNILECGFDDIDNIITKIDYLNSLEGIPDKVKSIFEQLLHDESVAEIAKKNNNSIQNISSLRKKYRDVLKRRVLKEICR